MTKKWEPTPEILKEVERLAALGMYEEQIALCVGIHPDTFSHKKAEYEQLSRAIKRGAAQGVALVTEKLIQNVQDGNVTAQIFYLKCKGGFKESKEENNVEGIVKAGIDAMKALAEKRLK